jgi:3-methyl-2-oxobutanoate hydroxymethyltransferase
MNQKTGIAGLRAMKQAGGKIACLTAYDAGFARLIDEAGMDLILVGDSLGMVVQGDGDTLSVTMEDMVYHTWLARRGVQRAVLAADMPYRSYDSVSGALDNAKQLVDAGAEMVKLEGAGPVLDVISRLVDKGIPVCGHLGLQPQSIEQYGGYKVQGRETEAAERIYKEALAVEEAGAELLVLECIPQALAGRISRALSLPVIGIGAGVDCDGQILVLHDILGVSSYIPRMANDFLQHGGSIRGAIAAYVQAVRSGEFPGAGHSFD